MVWQLMQQVSDEAMEERGPLLREKSNSTRRLYSLLRILSLRSLVLANTYITSMLIGMNVKV
jgi:hypothetical protein